MLYDISVGLVIALHGKETGAGDFMVEDVLEAGLPQQIDRPLNSGKSCSTSLSIILVYASFICNLYLVNGTGEDKFVVFVSGLSVGSSFANPLHFQLFVDHVTGHLGDEKVASILPICAFLTEW